MADSNRGMEGSEKHRTHPYLRTAVSAALVAGALAVAGCGGGSGDDNSAKPPAPVNKAPSSAGGVVTAVGTEGLVGPAGRASAKTETFSDRQTKIPRSANRRPKSANGVAGGEACTDTDITPDDGNLATVNASVLCLVNGERAAAGLSALAANSQLAQAAEGMCKRMVSEKFFAHETPDGKTVVDRVEPTGYIPNSGDWVVGENLAWGSGALSTPQAIVNGWMNSPGHKANVLASDYKDIGVAACMGAPAEGKSGGTVYVHNFGAKSGADVDASLPGAQTGSGASGGGDAGAGNSATVAGAKAKASKKAKKKKKKAKRKKRRR